MRVAALRLLDGDHAILRNLAESLGQKLTDLRIVVGADGSHLLNLVVVVVHLLGILLDIVNDGIHGLVDTALQVHGVGSGGHVLQALGHDGLCQDGSGGGSVAGIVASLRGHALHELCTSVLEVVFELNLLRHGHAVLRNLGSAELLLNHHVAALRTKCHLNCVSQLIHAMLQQVAGFNIEFDIFCHNFNL